MTLPARSMDTMGPEDMAIPEVKLVQNVGGAEAKDAGAGAGDFYCTVTGEVIKRDVGLDIVVVDIRKQRTYWGRTEIEDEPPICASLDAKVNMQGESCDQCPYDARCDTPWLLTAVERRSKCLLNYTILAIDVRNQLPILVRASGISTQGVRELVTSLKLNKQLKGEYYRALVHVGSQEKKTAAGEAFAMTLRATKLLSEPKQIEELKSQSVQLLGITLSLPEGVPAEPEGAPEVKAEPALRSPEVKAEPALRSPEVKAEPARKAESGDVIREFDTDF